MTNKEYIEVLSKELGYTQKRTADIVAAIVEVLIEQTQKGKVLSVSKFGVFELKKKMERISVIPSTQQRILVPPKMTLSFKPCTKMKARLNNKE